MTPADADRQNVEDFASESANLLRRALTEAAKRRAEEWSTITRPCAPPIRTVDPIKPSKLHEVDGVFRTIGEWITEYDIKKVTLYARLRKGMSLKLALETPVKHLKPRGYVSNFCS